MSKFHDEEKAAHLSDLWELQMFLGKILALDPDHARAKQFQGLVKMQQDAWQKSHLPKHLRLDKAKVHQLLDPELTRLRLEKKQKDV